ncbi:MAG: MerR family transcriptional regulator [Gammaproteobacteria bacterium]
MDVIQVHLTSSELITALERLEGKLLPARTLGHWAQAGLLTPSVEWAHTRRAGRMYSMRDLARARLILRLKRAHISPARVRLVLAHIEKYAPDVFRANTQEVLRLSGWDVSLQRPGEPAHTVPEGQFLLPLSDVMTGNLEAIEGIRSAA